MKDLIDIKIICESCNGHCDILNKDSELLHRCPMQKIAVWPGNNPLMTKAVLSLAAGRYESVFCKGCIFIDFSVNNIKLLTNKEWLQSLKKTGLSLILVSDRHLQHLAAYWQLRDMSIANVIYPAASLDEIKKAINGCYYGIRGGAGKETGSKKYLRPLKEEEVTFLNHMLSGHEVKSIAKHMNISTKKSYNLRASILRKMDLSLNALLTS